MNERAKVEKVTLYIPCYNAQTYIDGCLQGVLGQTYPVDEIIIVDDSPGDETSRIASRYPVTIIRRQPGLGLASAINVAFRQAKNEFVAAIHADCVPQPDWLEKLMENFTAENIAGVGGRVIEKSTDTLPDRWRSVHLKQDMGAERIVNPYALMGANNVFRKRAVEEVGFFNEAYKDGWEDVDISLRLRAKGFTLIYEPGAIVEHLRRDTISSVLEMHWRWHHPYPTRTAPLNISWKRFVKTLRSDLGRPISLAISDKRCERYSLLWIDFLLVGYYAKQLLSTTLRRVFQRRVQIAE